MRIGIDGLVLRGRDAGTLRYWGELLLGLAETDNANEYVVFANPSLRSLVPARKNLLFQPVPSVPGIPPILRQQLFRGWSARGKLDILHSPVSPPPLTFRHGKVVATVFDLAFELYPETTKWTGWLWSKIFAARGFARADHLVAISECTRNDLVRVFGLASDKISVIHPSPRDMFKPVKAPRTLLAKYDLPDPFILFVGTLQRRKNIASLIGAFAIAKRKAGLKHALVIAGQRGWNYREIFQIAARSGSRDEILFLDYVPDEDLPPLYSAADVLVNLSHYEGFGFPALEAMACGTPVLVSKGSALQEIVGDAGVLVAADDEQQSAAEIERIALDRGLHARLSERGLERARCFSREDFARKMVAVYNQTSLR